MTEKEMLHALTEIIEPVRGDIREVKEQVQNLSDRMEEVETGVQNLSDRMEKVEIGVQNLSDRMEKVETGVQNLSDRMEEVEERVKKIELTQEIDILPRLQNIEACYTSTYDRYKNNVDDYETIKEDVSILKQVVTGHSEKLQKIS